MTLDSKFKKNREACELAVYCPGTNPLVGFSFI